MCTEGCLRVGCSRVELFADGVYVDVLFTETLFAGALYAKTLFTESSSTEAFDFPTHHFIQNTLGLPGAAIQLVRSMRHRIADHRVVL